MEQFERRVITDLQTSCLRNGTSLHQLIPGLSVPDASELFESSPDITNNNLQIIEANSRKETLNHDQREAFETLKSQTIDV